MIVRFQSPGVPDDIIADSKDCYFKISGDRYCGYNKYTGEYFGKISKETFQEILNQEKKRISDYLQIEC